MKTFLRAGWLNVKTCLLSPFWAPTLEENIKYSNKVPYDGFLLLKGKNIENQKIRNYMYTCILVSGKLNYSALVFRKINVFVVGYPWPQTKVPPSSSVTPLSTGQGVKIRQKCSYSSRKGDCLTVCIVGKKDLTWEKLIYFNTNIGLGRETKTKIETTIPSFLNMFI